ncbi:MAG: dTDP-4-dehydrorhamnose 3,5-epimerase [Nodosilinea sp.]
MLFNPTPLAGAYTIDIDKKADERGFFARAFCAEEMAGQGLKGGVVQANLCSTHRQGTLRGLHYQTPPVTETKFIRCVRGAIYDVIVDMQPDSLTYLQHVGVELSADNRQALYVPQMFANGYLTLTDDVEIIYLVSEFYTPGYEQGVQYDDPKLGIRWPQPVTLVSEKDRSWPLL